MICAALSEIWKAPRICYNWPCKAPYFFWKWFMKKSVKAASSSSWET